MWKTQDNSEAMTPKDKCYTIFIVEDSDVYRSILLQELQSENESPESDFRYKLFGFSSGEECMEQLSFQKPDIMILDYFLNGNGYVGNMNGFELIRMVKKVCPQLDVIVLSCHENTRVIKELMQSGVKTFIRKESLGRHKVREMIKELIRKKEKRNSMEKYAMVAGGFVFLFFIILILNNAFNK